jgi:hypothetical protein
MRFCTRLAAITLVTAVVSARLVANGVAKAERPPDHQTAAAELHSCDLDDRASRQGVHP